MKTYLVTINGIALESADFHDAAYEANAKYRDTVECEVVSETADDVVLRVPPMFGLPSFRIEKQKYTSDSSTSLDGRAFANMTDFYEANLKYARHRLQTQLDLAVNSAEYDGKEKADQSYQDRCYYLSRAMEMFKDAYKTYFEHCKANN